MNLNVYYNDEYINNDTPVYEYDTLTTAGITYVRWENSAKEIFLKKIDESGSTIVITFAKDTWLNRVTATYLGYHEHQGA